MRVRAFTLSVLLVLFGAACNQADDPTDEDTTAQATDELGEGEFTLTGSLIDSKADVAPEGGIPDEDGEAIEDEDAGGIAVRPTSPADAQGLDDCETQKNAYVLYFTSDTTFDPSDAADADDFPQNLEGETVAVEGELREPAEADDASPAATDDCIAVATSVEIIEATQTDDGDDDGTTGDTDREPSVASPAVSSGSPDADESPDPEDVDFPDNADDANTIFEGTPSPDPCEGQKACEEQR
jgi:hypothetical protein